MVNIQVKIKNCFVKKETRVTYLMSNECETYGKALLTFNVIVWQ